MYRWHHVAMEWEVPCVVIDRPASPVPVPSSPFLSELLDSLLRRRSTGQDQRSRHQCHLSRGATLVMYFCCDS